MSVIFVEYEEKVNKVNKMNSCFKTLTVLILNLLKEDNWHKFMQAASS